MKKQFLCLLLTAVLSDLTQAYDGCLTYRAAVVEYHPETRTSETETVEANLLKYQNFMAEAKRKGAEIIVFPESGLLTHETHSYVPNPVDKIAPCDYKNYTKVLTGLSCASKSYSIYSVINLKEKRNCEADDQNCPSKGYYVFNTNVVFDRKGTVIARYAKYNLFDETLTDTTKDPEMVFFDTDFGVRFGTFICFDILFPTPTLKLIQQYRITDFVFPTFWFSELPFLTALQTQRGWAEANKVNLLASGVNFPSTGSGGSGIYNGKFGHIVQVMPETNTSKLLIADVPKISTGTCSKICQTGDSLYSEVVQKTARSAPSSNINAVSVESEGFKLLQDYINLFNSEVVEEGQKFEKTICSNDDFCCDFEVTMVSLNPNSKNFTCRAMVFNGVRRFGKNFKGGVQSCGIVMCNGPSIKNCTSRLKNISELFKFKHIRIKGHFKLRNSFQMPSTLTDGEELKPLPANKYDFNRIENNSSAEVTLELVWPVTNLHTFGIWGRDFTRDNEPEEPGSVGSLVTHMPILFISFIVFLLFAR